MTLTLAELAAHLQGELRGDGSLVVRGVSGCDTVAVGEVTFIENPRLLAQAEAGPALAVIVPLAVETSTKPLVRVAYPRLAFAQTLGLFECKPAPAPGVHPTAVVGQGCKLAAGCTIGPYAVLGDGVTLGEGTVVHAFVHIGEGTTIGAGGVIHSFVSLYHHVTIGNRVIVHSGTVIGGDGFGYVPVDGRYEKMPQIGTVIIGDDVEIGCGCCVDRATTAATVIGRGTKLDNLVQVAHNVQIGEDCVIAAQTGISGSCTVGNRVTIAGQVGLADHLHVGDGAILAAQAGVISDVAAGTMVSGYPARPHQEQMRVLAAGHKLPDTLVELRKLRARVEALEAKLADQG